MLKQSLKSKLDKLAERQNEIHALLSDPQVINNQNRFRELSKEAAEVTPVVSCYASYRKNLKAIEHANEMLQDPDKEIRALAADDLRQAREINDELELELQKLLLPKDAADDSNIFLEIRAGTGGKEAALFAADLLRMYTRYAETRGWKIETLSSTMSELGGYKEIILRVIGDGVYSRLKFESGVHRVQRVPARGS